MHYAYCNVGCMLCFSHGEWGVACAANHGGWQIGALVMVDGNVMEMTWDAQGGTLKMNI